MPARLHPVPETPPRVLGLVRVSRVGQRNREELVSPDTQRLAIEDYSSQRGYEITGWLEGIDESGSRARSAWWPRLDQAVASIEAGEYDVIVVWEFSRAARNRLRWAAAIDRVEAAGGRLESATERVDVTTASGRFQRGVLSEMHTYRAEAIGEGWRDAHAARVRAGKPISGKPRFGYRYDQAAKVHRPDPVTGPVLADLYRRYVAGESVYQLVRWLNAHGYQTVPGYGKTVSGPWSDRSLRRVLDSGFASGQFMAGGDRARGIAPTLHQGVHEPLIDGQLWQAYLDARVERRSRPARTERSPYLLSGLVRCARCGGRMVAGQYGHARAAKYRCRNGKEIGPAVCAGGYVMAEYVEAAVYEWLQDRAARVDDAADEVEGVEVRRASLQAQEAVLVRQMRRAEEALTRFAVQHAKDPMPELVYREALAALTGELEELEGSLESVRREGRRAPVDVAAVAAGLVEEWGETSVGVRREVLRSLLDCVLVRTGRPRAWVLPVEAWMVRPGAGGF